MKQMKQMKIITTLILLLMITLSCSSDETENDSIPTIISLETTNVSSMKATLKSNITNQGSSELIERGMVWSLSENPDLNDFSVPLSITTGNGLGEFYVTITGLELGTTYYARAYAKNEFGVAYSNEISFITLSDYQIGDIGPAGGVIFYDKGVFNNGWRYLEATTENQDGGPVWGCYGVLMNANGITFGSGFENTNIILSNCSDAVSAAKVCADYVQNGYDDWYLPSIDELEQMIIHERNTIGGFVIGSYTSSTEHSATHSLGYLITSTGFFTDNRPKQNNSRVRAIRRF